MQRVITELIIQILDLRTTLFLGLYRQCGDIDIYVPCGMEKALRWCREKFGDVEYDYINAHVPVFKDVEVELHWRVSSMASLFKNKRLQQWLECEENKKMICGGRLVLPNGGEITVPTPDFNTFYMILHCYNHAFQSGLGLRQLMDYYFLLMFFPEIHGDAYAISNAKQLFKKLGMERFVGGVMWIMQEVFMMGRERLLYEPNEKEGRYILAEVMAGGNFGHYDEKIKKVGRGKWRSIFVNLQHTLYVLRRYTLEALWMPLWIVYHFVWKRVLNSYN